MRPFAILQSLSFVSALFFVVAITSLAEEKGIADFPQLSAERDWPWWRGPSRNGMAAKGSVPTTLSETDNLAWKTPVPGRGHSSPTVVKDRVFLTTSNVAEQIHSVIAFDRATDNCSAEGSQQGGFPAKTTRRTPRPHRPSRRMANGYSRRSITTTRWLPVCLDFRWKIVGTRMSADSGLEPMNTDLLLHR